MTQAWIFSYSGYSDDIKVDFLSSLDKANALLHKFASSFGEGLEMTEFAAAVLFLFFVFSAPSSGWYFKDPHNS